MGQLLSGERLMKGERLGRHDDLRVSECLVSLNKKATKEEACKPGRASESDPNVVRHFVETGRAPLGTELVEALGAFGDALS